MRYATPNQILRYPAISSNVLWSSLRAFRRNILTIPKNILRRRVIAKKIIRFLCFLIRVRKKWTFVLYWNDSDFQVPILAFIFSYNTAKFYVCISDIHLLYLLVMCYGVEFYISLFYGILEHISDFSNSVVIQIIDSFI